MVEETGGRAREAAKNIFKKGLLRLFETDDETGDESEEGKVKRWLGNKWQGVKDTAGESFVGALEDEEVQGQGAEYVKQTVSEAVEGIKGNFKSALQNAAEKIQGENPEVTSVYDAAKSLLRADEGKWYARVGKKAAARLIAWTAPVLSFVGANVAGRLLDKQEEVGDYRKGFMGMIKGVLARVSPNVAAPAEG